MGTLEGFLDDHLRRTCPHDQVMGRPKPRCVFCQHRRTRQTVDETTRQTTRRQQDKLCISSCIVRGSGAVKTIEYNSSLTTNSLCPCLIVVLLFKIHFRVAYVIDCTSNTLNSSKDHQRRSSSHSVVLSRILTVLDKFR